VQELKQDNCVCTGLGFKKTSSQKMMTDAKEKELKEIKEMGKTWEGIKFMAKDRQMWRERVAALHAS